MAGKGSGVRQLGGFGSCPWRIWWWLRTHKLASKAWGGGLMHNLAFWSWPNSQENHNCNWASRSSSSVWLDSYLFKLRKLWLCTEQGSLLFLPGLCWGKCSSLKRWQQKDFTELKLQGALAPSVWPYMLQARPFPVIPVWGIVTFVNLFPLKAPDLYIPRRDPDLTLCSTEGLIQPLVLKLCSKGYSQSLRNCTL